jgi:D-arabinan exo alpha-(1,3)/(1,5)-arabinofuranosidase (non-reducing end)
LSIQAARIGRDTSQPLPVWLEILQLAVVLSALMLAAVMASADEPPLIPVGADAYRMWERWPYQRIGERSYMRSTYDRSGGNESADASHFLYQLADDYNVTLDVEGAGVLYFVRTNRWHGSPWHYAIDGVDHVVAESSTADPLHPATNAVFLPQEPFPHPPTWTWSQTHGADLSWVPIGFLRSLRLAYARTFYGTGYYIYHQFVAGIPLSRPIVAWDGASAPDPEIGALLSRAGTDIAPPAGVPGVTEDEGRLDLPARASMLVWRGSDGPAMLRALEFSVPRDQALDFGAARLRILWDDRRAPSIDVPIALFFGAGVLYNRDQREYLVKALPIVVRYTADRVYLRCFFPMPYFRSARIELVGAAHTAISDMRWSLRRTRYPDAPNQVGYFHATYRDHPGRAAPAASFGRDLVLLDTRQTEGGGAWSGSFVGTSFIFSHNAEFTGLEGDPRFFFDDSLTPQAQGTGTEEWAGGGDYWGGQTMSLPLAGHPIGASSRESAISAIDRIESGYRFLLADLMPFGKNARIQLEHGGNDESTEHYESVTYWYGLPAASLIKTDELAVGDLASERRHHYESPDASPVYELRSRYEWGPDAVAGREIYPTSTDRGRTTKAASEFDLSIDPRNVGVMLRRKLDYAFPNQRAEVYVRSAGMNPTWDLAGIWYLAGSNTDVFSDGGGQELGETEHIAQTSNRRFRDDEFLVPRALTENRSRVRFRIQVAPVQIPLYPGAPSPQPEWSELRYSAYSFVVPAFELPTRRH